MNAEIGTETPIFLFWEYLYQIFGILSLQCMAPVHSNNIASLPQPCSTREQKKTKKLFYRNLVEMRPLALMMRTWKQAY